MHTNFNISGMTCMSCVSKLTKKFEEKGFKNINITLHPPKGTLSHPSPVSMSEIQSVASEAGNYSVSDTRTEHAQTHENNDSNTDENITPLFIILSYLVGGVFLRAYLLNDYSIHSSMNFFMGGFFVLFSLFKMINLRGFAEAYATYDILAARSRMYALAYPFIELFLGIAYLTEFLPVLTNSIVVCLMGIGSVGVYKALKTNKDFQCACLGTALQLPMTKITLVEDITMGGMALYALFHILSVTYL